jgi:Zn-dependent peptidase ImmA (M78 family)
MKYVVDRTGRFPKRPHYESAELDQECERIITEFMRQQCGGFSLPLPTDALTKLIERDAEDLDLFADLTEEGHDVEGVTDFQPKRKPKVRISQTLSNRSNEHRLRTTLAHEYGHVKFHDFLWQLEASDQKLHPQFARQTSPKCNRQRILDAPRTDWMEWQAGYVCGALLMPVTHIRTATAQFLETHKLFAPVAASSQHAGLLINMVHKDFGVSLDAARVRLMKLNLLTATDLGPQLL